MLVYSQNKDDFNQGELYKILTQFMGAFRRFIKTSQHICKTIAKPATSNQHISSLNDILCQFKTLANFQNNQYNPSPQHQYTIGIFSVYLRFTARLFQIISLAKSYQSQSSNISSLYRQFIGKTEDLINNFKIKRNLSLLFKSIFYLSTNFYDGCNLIMKNGSIKEALQVLSKIAIEQKPLNDFLFKKDFEFNKKVQISSKPVLSQSQLRLFTINCMDVDCEYVTSMIFLANNKKEEVVRLMNQRNRHISQIINSYYKQFHYYLKRLQRISSKNKLKHGKSVNYHTFTNNFKMKNKIKTIQTNPNIYLYQSPLSSTKLEKEGFNLSCNNSPVKKIQAYEGQEAIHYLNSFHPIKNTYLTFHNIQTQSVKQHKTTKNAYFRNAEDAKKIKYILKSYKYNLNSQKSQQSPPPQQTAILEIKKFNLNSQVQRNNEKLLQLFSIGSKQQDKMNIQTSQKWQIISKNKKIRNIRKSQMSKTFSKFNASTPKQIISTMGVSFRTKTQISIKQMSLK